MTETISRLGYTPNEVAVALGLTPEAVRYRIRRGSIPARRCGPREWRVPASWLLDFNVSGTTVSDPP